MLAPELLIHKSHKVVLFRCTIAGGKREVRLVRKWLCMASVQIVTHSVVLPKNKAKALIQEKRKKINLKHHGFT